MYYVDPSSMVLKGQIPFTSKLRAEAKNFKNFLVHTVIRLERLRKKSLLTMFYSLFTNSRGGLITWRTPKDSLWNGVKL
jgi:PH domain